MIKFHAAWKVLTRTVSKYGDSQTRVNWKYFQWFARAKDVARSITYERDSRRVEGPNTVLRW